MVSVPTAFLSLRWCGGSRHHAWDLKGFESENRGIVGRDTDGRRAMGPFARRPMGAVCQPRDPPRHRGLGYQDRRASGRLRASNRQSVSGQFLRRRPLGALHFRGSRPPAAHVGRALPRAAKRFAGRVGGPGSGRLSVLVAAAGRIYFTHERDGFECIFTRAVDPATKRPLGAPAEVHRFEGRLTPRNFVAGRLPHLRGPRQAGLRAGRAGAPAVAEAVTERTRRGSVPLFP